MPKKEKTFLPKDVLYKQGDACDEVYTILEGKVELFYEINGKVKVIGRKGEDDVLGGQSILDGTYDVSARAVTDVTVAVQSKDEYIAELQRSGELSPHDKEQKSSFLDDDDDDNPFNFSFDDEEEKPKQKPSVRQRPTSLRSRPTSTALSKRTTDVDNAFSFDDEKTFTSEKDEKTALVKVEKQKIAPVIIEKKPVIVPAEIKKHRVKEWLRENIEATVSFGPTILFAAIDRDDKDVYRNRFYNILSEVPNLQVKVVDKSINDTHEKRAMMQMRSWLEQHDADLGLYAFLNNAGTVLEFHTVRLEKDNPNSVFHTGSRFFLPLDSSAEQKTLLKIFVVCAMPIKRLEHEQLQKLFLPRLIQEVLAYASEPMIGLSPEEQGANLVAFANVLSWLSLMKIDENYQAHASAIYKKALALLPIHAPEFVFVNRQVGLMLQIEGERNENIESFKVAEQTFQKGLEAVSEHYQPEAYSDLHLRIGNVQQKIALQTGQGTDFVKAMTSYRDALKVINPTLHTEQWADSVNGLARTLQVFSSFNTKTTLLEKAVDLYEKELSILNKDTHPILWARASNNLASALFLLSDRQGVKPDLLRRAVDVFSQALQIYDKVGAYQMATVADKNLKRVEKILSNTEKEMEKNKSWLDDILQDTGVEPVKQDSTEITKPEEPLLFERIAIFEELEEE